MNKKTKILSLLLCAILTVSLFVACGEKNNEEVTINFFNWAENIPDSVIEDFEKETGIKVIQEKYSTVEQMYSKVSSGAVQYDVLVPSDFMVERLMQEGRLEELNFNNIPNFKNIHQDHLNKSFDPGNKYSVPYMSGTIGIVYNKNMVKEPVKSWDILWDEKYGKNVLMLDSERDALGVALKKLGYSLNTTDEKQLKEAENELKKLKDTTFKAFGNDNFLDMMIQEEAAFAVLWSGEGLNLADEYDYLEFVVPEEGANFWIDSLVIPKGTKHKKEAEMFINYLCEKDPALLVADEIGYTTPNKLAREEQPDSIKNNPNAYMSKELVDKCESYAYLGDKVKLYTDTFIRVMNH